MRFYKLENGIFVEDNVNGIVPGLQYDDLFGNSYRLILESLDFSTLRYNQDLPYTYAFELLVEGSVDWLHLADKRLAISRGDHYIDIATQTLVDLATAGTMDEFGVVTFNPGYQYELDYFINAFKGEQPYTYTVYEYLVRQAAIAEGVDFDTWDV